MEYQIIEECGIIELEHEVNKLIKKGWKPQGGVSVIKVGYEYYYTQAIIKE